MILVDTSVWATHIDRAVAGLSALLDRNEVLVHPYVVGELAMGNLRERHRWLHDLALLPQAVVATHWETMHLIEGHRLFGRGIGYVDAHLIAATRILDGALLWTFDRRLEAVAVQMKVVYQP